MVKVFNKIVADVFEFCGGYRDIPGLSSDVWLRHVSGMSGSKKIARLVDTKGLSSKRRGDGWKQLAASPPQSVSIAPTSASATVVPFTLASP
jgi:hypothetical protein